MSKNDKKDDGGDLSAARLVASGAMLVPGPIGYVADVSNLALTGVDADQQAERERRALRNEFGVEGSLKHTGSQALREMDSKIDGRMTHEVGDTVASISGGMAGTAAATAAAAALLTGPVGWMTGMLISGAGGLAGGILTHTIYEKATERADPDALVIERGLEKRGGPIQAEEAFAVLAANIPTNSGGKELRDALEAETGTRSFSQALKQGKIEAIQKLMHDDKYAFLDTIIAAATDMGSVPGLSVAERYAGLINNGKFGELGARALLVHKYNFDTLMAESGISPADFQVQQLASNLRQSGVSPALDNGKVQLLPLPSQEIGRS